MASALGIKPGVGFDFLDERINYLINEKFPKIETLKSLPNMKPDSISIKQTSNEVLDKEYVFGRLDSITLGAWSKFYEINFIKVIRESINEDFKQHIKKKIADRLSNSFTYSQLAMLMESGVESLIVGSRPNANRTKSIESYHDLLNFIKDSIRSDIYAELNDIIIDAVIDVDHKSEYCSKVFDSLKNELNNINDNNEKADMNSINIFYGNTVRNYLSKIEIIEKIREEFKRFDTNKQTILNKLRDNFGRIVETCPEYRLPFEQELATRMAAVGQTGALNIIASSLQADDDKIICLKSPVPPEYRHGYYLARKQAEYLQLVEMQSNSIGDTSSIKSAEHLRVYACKISHLLRE
jgi:hypothetical protein